MESNDKGVRVLIVEDDQFLLETLARRFKENGFKTDYLSEGNGVIEKVINFKPDIVLLDILLPGKSGFDICKEIKNNPETKNIPVVFLSNLGSREDIEKGKQLGAASFLVKATVLTEEIVKEVKKVLSGAPGQVIGETP